MQHDTFYQQQRATQNHPVRKCKKRQAVKQKQLRIDEILDIIISSFEADLCWSHKILLI